MAGAPDEAFKLGDHTLGRPFHDFKEEKNVFDQLSDGSIFCKLLEFSGFGDGPPGSVLEIGLLFVREEEFTWKSAP